MTGKAFSRRAARLLTGLVGLLAVAALSSGGVLARQSPPATKAGQTSSGAPQGQTAARGQTDGQGRPGGGPSQGPGGPRSGFTWWKDPAVVKEIGLSADQTAKIERIYDQRNKKIAAYVEEFDKQRAELDRMMHERTVTPTAIELQASKLMPSQNKIDESRWVMLYQIYMVLSADQNKKLQAIRDRNDQGRGRGGRGGNPGR